MENITITLQEAADIHYNVGSSSAIGTTARAKYEEKNASFKAGAQWQQEQEGELITTLQVILDMLPDEDELSKEYLKQRIAAISSKIKKTLKNYNS
jgi:hypothetical protein